MPKRAKELTAIEIRRLTHSRKSTAPVSVPVGGVAGLYMQITTNNAKSWVLRYSSPTRTIQTKTGTKQERRKMGLGPYPEITLARAHDKARMIREGIADGIDPLDARQQTRAEARNLERRKLTFAAATDFYLESKLDEFKNAKHKQQWDNTLKAYAFPELGDMACNDIDIAAVLRVLTPIWRTKTETAKRLRGRIERVLAWAIVNGHKTGDNPARWSGNLDTSLPKPGSIKVETGFPMVALGDLTAWMRDLQARKGTSARALEFVALTAARSGEVRGATWDQIDLEEKIWTRPADHMKMNRKHSVALSDAAVALLKTLPRFQDVDLVFPAPRMGKLSDMALSAVMRRVHTAKADQDQKGYIDPETGRPGVPHGLRASFKTWATERTNFPRELAEFALSHKVGNDVEVAYNRGDALERRRALAERWSDHLHGKAAASDVVQLHG